MKTPKARANYREAFLVDRLLGRTCHGCVHIQLHGARPATCELVEGDVERRALCDLFERR